MLFWSYLVSYLNVSIVPCYFYAYLTSNTIFLSLLTFSLLLYILYYYSLLLPQFLLHYCIIMHSCAFMLITCLMHITIMRVLIFRSSRCILACFLACITCILACFPNLHHFVCFPNLHHFACFLNLHHASSFACSLDLFNICVSMHCISIIYCIIYTSCYQSQDLNLKLLTPTNLY